MEKKMKVWILIGLPGSGKSTWATKNLPQAEKFGADDYFLKDGKYVFNPHQLQKAHDECLRRYLSALSVRVQQMVVDNTNLSLLEIAPYLRSAQAFGAEVELRGFDVTVEEAFKRNIHGVPKSALEAMHYRFQGMLKAWPPWWPSIVWTR